MGSDNLNWDAGVKKYTRQKDLLTKNERIFGTPDSDAEEVAEYIEPARVQRPKPSKSKKSATLLVDEPSDEKEEESNGEEDKTEEVERTVS